MLPPVAHAGRFLMSQLVLAGFEPTILWLGVRRANHWAIATRQSEVTTVLMPEASNYIYIRVTTTTPVLGNGQESVY